MGQHQVRRLPVVHRNIYLFGIILRADIAHDSDHDQRRAALCVIFEERRRTLTDANRSSSRSESRQVRRLFLNHSGQLLVASAWLRTVAGCGRLGLKLNSALQLRERQPRDHLENRARFLMYDVLRDLRGDDRRGLFRQRLA
jgi:hypothetical protein